MRWTTATKQVLNEDYAARQGWDRTCDAAEKRVRSFETKLLALISEAKDNAALDPDFSGEWNYLADVLEGDRTDWLHGDVMAAIKLMRENG